MMRYVRTLAFVVTALVLAGCVVVEEGKDAKPSSGFSMSPGIKITRSKKSSSSTTQEATVPMSGPEIEPALQPDQK